MNEASGVPVVIRRSEAGDIDALLDLWLRSVEATHTFVSQEHIRSFIPGVRDYLAAAETELWVLCTQDGTPLGFMGLSDNRIDSLFLDPAHHRRGGGRRLVHHAESLRGELTVDVNEQNTAACRFYEACGFVVEGRSETDAAGLPYPLLHMRKRGA